jgi:hypothetical protein
MEWQIERRRVLANLLASSGLLASCARATTSPEPLNLWNFLSPEMRADVVAGTLRVDCGQALQRALDAASGATGTSLQSGARLRIPAGRYLIETPVRIASRRTMNIVDDRDLRRPTIEGDGQANTELYIRTSGSQPACSIGGNSFERREGTHLYLSFRGLRLQRDLDTTGTGIGIDIREAAFLHFEDVHVAGFGTGLRGRDVLRGQFVNSYFLGGQIGLDLQPVRYSNPNLIRFSHCSFGGNQVAGAVIHGAANVSFDSCSFEGIGSDRTASHALLLRDGPAEGGSAIRIENCYFENNQVAADVMFDWHAPVSGTAAIVSSTFQRVSMLRYATHHLVFAAHPPTALVALVQSCGFKLAGPASSLRALPSIATRGSGVRLTQMSNYFDTAEAERL